jgi:hypothetical protein
MGYEMISVKGLAAGKDSKDHSKEQGGAQGELDQFTPGFVLMEGGRSAQQQTLSGLERLLP